jgi:hypothetical protein
MYTRVAPVVAALLLAAALIITAPGGRAGGWPAGLAGPATVADFQDVPTGSAFYGYVHNLVVQGIVTGYACGGAGEPCVAPTNLPYYRPAADVTRQQMSKFVDLGRHQPGIDIRTGTDIPPLYIQTASATIHAAVEVSSTNAPAVQGTTSAAGRGGVAGINTAFLGAGVTGQGNYGGVFTGTTAGLAAVQGTGRGFNSIGVFGYADIGDQAIAVWGESSSGYAGYFNGKVTVVGNLAVNGTLSKSAGSFKIDDPLDPAHKYLYHSFVESPDMMNIYNGNVTTDANGDATITLPAWFEKLNQEYRYQLTPIGQFAQAIVATKIAHNQFSIKTDKPYVEVSWQVTGVRHDPYAEQNRIPVEQTKPAAEQGTYLYPQGYSQPPTVGADYARAHKDTLAAPAK